MILLDGQVVAKQILAQTKQRVDPKNPPFFDIILVGDDPLSVKYTTIKSKKAKKLGIKANIHRFASKANQSQIISLINNLNQSRSNGIMVQLPLPDHLNQYQILNTIDPVKDIDGLNSTNLGLLFQNQPNRLVSATALAIYKILSFYKIDLKGKNVVIVNNTPLVGLPLAAILNNHHATVTICHKYSQDVNLITKKADIIISAVGISNFIKLDMVKGGAVVIGAGFSKNHQTGKVEGDLDFNNLAKISGYITPNTGGVGPVTVACLLSNVIKVYRHGLSKNSTF